jgi:dihydrolipoamide dehydrogenase
MPMEAFDGGTLAVIAIPEGGKAPVGAVLGVIATGSEKMEDVKKNFKPSQSAPAAGGGSSGGAQTAQATKEKTSTGPLPSSNPEAPNAAKAASTPSKPAASKPAAVRSSPGKYQFDILVIGGGPAGYAAAIRAGQLKKRVLCVEKENLGGTCLNWGCIPTKALLEDGNFLRKMRTEAADRGISFDNLKVDFSKIVGRSRSIADKLSKGIAHLFRKYEVKSEIGTAKVLGPHKVEVTTKEGRKEVTADHIIVAVGAKTTPLPGVNFDGKCVITSREAMYLHAQPKKLAIIGAGAIGCEFADFYSALGTEVTLIEMQDHLLPNEDQDVSVLLERLFPKHGIDVRVKTKTDKVEVTDKGVKLTLSGGKAGVVEADAVLVAVGVTGNADDAADSKSGLELFKGRVKVTPDYHSNLENVWAVGDCIAMHWSDDPSMAGYRHPDLAHIAHHEAVKLVEAIAGQEFYPMDYRQIPGCTYTHPQVASMGYTEIKARELGRAIKIGKFPFSASGRALAAGESDGFVKLIFDAQYGELLGVHMIGENVTELISELVMARNLEATESEIIEAIHPHPTMSEAVMEAAGVAVGRAIHL